MKPMKAYICSPLSAPTAEGIRRNMEAARWYMQTVSKLWNCRAVAPHAYLPVFLDDKDEQERQLALSFGLSYLDTCDRLVICGSRITKGMLGEIHHAAAQEIPIFWIREDYSLCRSIGKIEYEEIQGW